MNSNREINLTKGVRDDCTSRRHCHCDDFSYSLNSHFRRIGRKYWSFCLLIVRLSREDTDT